VGCVESQPYVYELTRPPSPPAFNERQVTVALAKPASVKKKERAEKAAARKAAKKAEKAEKAEHAAPSEQTAQASASAGVAGAEGEGDEVKKPKKKKRSNKVGFPAECRRETARVLNFVYPCAVCRSGLLVVSQKRVTMLRPRMHRPTATRQRRQRPTRPGSMMLALPRQSRLSGSRGRSDSPTLASCPRWVAGASEHL
jgi:hypothetical protein